MKHFCICLLYMFKDFSKVCIKEQQYWIRENEHIQLFQSTHTNLTAEYKTCHCFSSLPTLINNTLNLFGGRKTHIMFLFCVSQVTSDVEQLFKFYSLFIQFLFCQMPVHIIGPFFVKQFVFSFIDLQEFFIYPRYYFFARYITCSSLSL